MIVGFEERFSAGLVADGIKGGAGFVSGFGSVVSGDVLVAFGFEFALFGTG